MNDRERYAQLHTHRSKVREKLEKQRKRVAAQQLVCDSFIVRGKKVPWLYQYNLESFTKKMYDLEGLEMYLSNEIERMDQL